MKGWGKLVAALVAPLLLTGCLWGPGKFTSDLTLRKDGTFILDYRGEIILQLPSDEGAADAWTDDKAHCSAESPDDEERACTPAEIAQQKAEYEKNLREKTESKRKDNEDMAKAFGLSGLDDEANRAFAAKLMKYEGWRSVTYRGKGVFDVDYHFQGHATQDFLFPTMPDNDMVIPFIAIRRRTDGTVLVTAPAMTGGSGPIAARAGQAAASAAQGGPVSRAQGRLTIITDGEILTNNSEDGAAAHPIGRQIHWDVGATSTKIPETLIRMSIKK